MGKIGNPAENSSCLNEIILGNGSCIIEFNGYSGEGDFMKIYDIINRLIQPERLNYTVDSLCVMGSFVKDGILVRMSSEGITEHMCFEYRKSNFSDADIEKVQDWTNIIAEELQKIAPRI